MIKAPQPTTTEAASGEPEVAVFYKNLVKKLQEQTGPFTEETFKQAAILAAQDLSPAARIALLENIATQPAGSLSHLNTEKAKSESTSIFMSTISYGLRFRGIPFVRHGFISVMVGAITPYGNPALLSKVVYPTLELSGDFLAVMCDRYLCQLETASILRGTQNKMQTLAQYMSDSGKAIVRKLPDMSAPTRFLRFSKPKTTAATAENHLSCTSILSSTCPGTENNRKLASSV